MNLGEIAALENRAHRSHRGPRHEAAQKAHDDALWAAMAADVGGKWLDPEATTAPPPKAPPPTVPKAAALSFFDDLARELRAS